MSTENTIFCFLRGFTYTWTFKVVIYSIILKWTNPSFKMEGKNIFQLQIQVWWLEKIYIEKQFILLFKLFLKVVWNCYLLKHVLVFKRGYIVSKTQYTNRNRHGMKHQTYKYDSWFLYQSLPMWIITFKLIHGLNKLTISCEKFLGLHWTILVSCLICVHTPHWTWHTTSTCITPASDVAKTEPWGLISFFWTDIAWSLCKTKMTLREMTILVYPICFSCRYS